MYRTCLVLALVGALAWPAAAQEEEGVAHEPELRGGGGQPFTLVVREASIAEVFEMLARYERVNILLGEGVEGEVSVSLFEESFDRVVRAVAESAGYTAERRGPGYVIVERDEAGRDSANGNTIIRTLKAHYTDAKVAAEILDKHLSRYGELTVLESRSLIVVEDLPEFVDRIEGLLAEIDKEPHQILIEAKIFEISLEEGQNLGIDWVRTFEAFDGVGDIGVIGLASPTQPGLVFDLVTPEMVVLLTALADDGRVRTLSTPTLLTLEHEEAEVVIGDRLGFRVITTQNTVTTESVEFLESGVILRIEAALDRTGRIMLSVHPEVSTGVIQDGLPNQTTTEVTTKLIADDGVPVFIAGLIRDRNTHDNRGVPLLKDVPWAGKLFSRDERFGLRSETVVILTAHALPESRERAVRAKTRWLPHAEAGFRRNQQAVEESVSEERALREPLHPKLHGEGESGAEAPEADAPAEAAPDSVDAGPDPGSESAEHWSEPIQVPIAPRAWPAAPHAGGDPSGEDWTEPIRTGVFPRAWPPAAGAGDARPASLDEDWMQPIHPHVAPRAGSAAARPFP